jgi:hypothetical protein
MTDETLIKIFVLLWLAISAIIVYQSWNNRLPTSGLSVIYIAIFTALHFLGALIFIFPWYLYGDLNSTLHGFREATYGLIAFGFGNLILAPYLIKLFYLNKLENMPDDSREPNNESSNDLPKLYFMIGLFSYFVLQATIGHIPTIQALVSLGRNLMVVGLCAALYLAIVKQERKNIAALILISLAFPFITILNQGFLSYGAVMTLTCFLFFARFYRPKWKLIVMCIIAAYLGLTFYETYKRDRPELREVTWGNKSLSTRVDGLKKSLEDPEWFNPFDISQLNQIDDRLNQNFLIGVAIKKTNRLKNFAYGSTIWESILALVPRIVWPEKPIFAGSGNLVSQYTGIKFAKGTSVAVGPVMEFYINFGTTGVLIGFMVLGTIVMIVDFMSGLYLRYRNWPKFILWFLPGLALIKVEGSFVDVVGATGASIVVALLLSPLQITINRYYKYLFFTITLLLLTKILLIPVIEPILSYVSIIFLLFLSVILIKKYLLPIFKRKVHV